MTPLATECNTIATFTWPAVLENCTHMAGAGTANHKLHAHSKLRPALYTKGCPTLYQLHLGIHGPHQTRLLHGRAAVYSVLEAMLSKLQLQEPQAAIRQPDRLNTQTAEGSDSTEPLPEATLQLTGLHSSAHTAADYLTPAGGRWTHHKVSLWLQLFMTTMPQPCSAAASKQTWSWCTTMQCSSVVEPGKLSVS